MLHALGIKSAMTRRTHPQHSFSKGGGFAKRPQFAVPQRGAGVLLDGSVKSPGPEGFPFLTFPAASARPPTLPVEVDMATVFRLFSIFFACKKTLKKRIVKNSLFSPFLAFSGRPGVDF